MRGMFDLLMDETLHCKWYFTYIESQNKDFVFLRIILNTSSRVKYLFHKDKHIWADNSGYRL